MEQLHPGKFSKASSDWLTVSAPRQRGEVNRSMWKTYLDPPRFSGPSPVISWKLCRIADYISLFTNKRLQLQPTPRMLVEVPQCFSLSSWNTGLACYWGCYCWRAEWSRLLIQIDKDLSHILGTAWFFFFFFTMHFTPGFPGLDCIPDLCLGWEMDAPTAQNDVMSTFMPTVTMGMREPEVLRQGKGRYTAPPLRKFLPPRCCWLDTLTFLQQVIRGKHNRTSEHLNSNCVKGSLLRC